MRRLLIACLASALQLLAAAPSHALSESSYLLAVGNNLGDADEVELLYAERDAQAMAAALQNHGGIPATHTTLLLGQDAGTMRKALVELNKRIRNSSQEDAALVVFYSGHADDQALHLGGSQLPFDELRDLVESSAAGMRLLIVDSCRSGVVTRVKGVKAAPEFRIAVEDSTSAEGMVIITSSAAGESSQESDALRASFFSHHLVNALRGAADTDTDGRITLEEAYGYTYSQTLRSSARTLATQHPTYEYAVKGKGEVVLARRENAQKRTGTLRLGPAGVYIINENNEGGPVTAEVAPQQEDALIALAPRSYFVQRRDAREYREYTVRLEAGETLDLEQQPYKSIQYDRLVRRRGGAKRSAHGLMLLGGGRGQTVAGQGATPQVTLGYNVDLPWFTFGTRLRTSFASLTARNGITEQRHNELGLGVAIERFIDFSALSVSFGILAEGAWVRQSFDNVPDQDARNSLSGAFAGLLGLERSLGAGLSLRLEGGPVTVLERRIETENGAPVRGADPVLDSTFTWWASGGLRWRL